MRQEVRSACSLTLSARGRRREARTYRRQLSTIHYASTGAAWVPLSINTSVLLSDIPLEGVHKVLIRGDDRPFSAFSFSFTERGRSDLCLSQSGLYLTWRFHPSPTYGPCQCKGIMPVRWARVFGTSSRP